MESGPRKRRTFKVSDRPKMDPAMETSVIITKVEVAPSGAGEVLTNTIPHFVQNHRILPKPYKSRCSIIIQR